MKEVPADGAEARRWTVVFHRKAENWFFDAIAMGHFKHVSAFAWLPEADHWLIYDVGFRRTRLRLLGDTASAKAVLTGIVSGNVTVTIDIRNELPWMRLGLFCTTAVSHLIGVRCASLRPDALYRHLIAKGGTVRDHDAAAEPAENRRRSEPRGRAGAGAEDVAGLAPDAGTG